MRFMTMVFVGLLLIAAGCGGPADGRMEISGTVTLNGEALDRAMIQFCSTKPGTLPLAGAMIQSGKYSVPREQGLVAGDYRVDIFAPGELVRPEKMDHGPHVGQIPRKERVPPRYNVQSTLRVAVENGRKNVFDFQLEAGRAEDSPQAEKKTALRQNPSEKGKR